MSTEVSEVLRHSHTLFRKCLNFQSISPHLRSHNLLTDNEWELISKKESREDQVDEFLKCLPHKGKGCLNRLVECLQSSLDHSGHHDIINELNKQPIPDVSQSKLDHSVSQDEFERAVSTINTLYSSQKETMASLMEKLNQQEAKIKHLQSTCNDQATTIQQLSDTVSTQKADIVTLNAKLQEKHKLLQNSWPNYINGHSILNGYSYDSEQYLYSEYNNMSSSSSQDSVLSNDYFECGPPPVLVTDGNDGHSDALQKLSPIMHPKLSRNPSIEDKLKQYQRNMASYREKCRQLEEEKERLKEAKYQLQQEVVQLREELEAVSLTSSISSITFQMSNSQSGSVTSAQAMTIMPVVSDNMYLNAIHQGWLTKEGGHNKNWKRRWCMLSSRFFFYFEDEKVELKNRRPLGILPLTKHMEVTDCKKDNMFEIHEKSRGNMKSCKLDKNRGVYTPEFCLVHFGILQRQDLADQFIKTQTSSITASSYTEHEKPKTCRHFHGNHAVYNLQASDDDDKKEWIKAFEEVFESLKLCN